VRAWTSDDLVSAMGQAAVTICSKDSKGVYRNKCPKGGVACVASIAQMELCVSREQFTESYQRVGVTGALKKMPGIANPSVAFQFGNQKRATQIVPYLTKKCAELAKSTWEATFQQFVDLNLIDGIPQHRYVQGNVWPVARFAYDEECTLIPCGMSFAVYPLKVGTTLEEWRGLFTDEAIAELSTEFGLLWLFTAVHQVPNKKPTGYISGLYQCCEAAASVQPKVRASLKKLGLLDLLSALPYERTVGAGLTIKTS